jgi:alkanesulfonate monooxygenase SsuD/methylene tetrahydromethanopterin reductase-like flavin-dependent oxidoreductase (luciferase family)
VKLGLWLTARYAPDRTPEAHMAAMREQVALARDAGFGMISSGQHYLAPRLQTFPLLARLIEDAGDMEMATSVLLLPLHHPVAVAEDAATMNAMVGGRFVLGLGLGHDDLEQAAFGVAARDRSPRFREAVELMRHIWAGDGRAYRGQYFNVPARDAAPATSDSPRLWVGGNSGWARERAAVSDAAWLPTGLDIDTMIAGRDDVRRRVAEIGASPSRDSPAGMWVHVDTDEQRAQEAARRAGHLRAGQERRPGYAIGTPQTVLETLDALRERAAVTHLLCRIEAPGMDQRDVLRRIDLLGSAVIPALSAE